MCYFTVPLSQMRWLTRSALVHPKAYTLHKTEILNANLVAISCFVSCTQPSLPFGVLRQTRKKWIVRTKINPLHRQPMVWVTILYMNRAQGNIALNARCGFRLTHVIGSWAKLFSLDDNFIKRIFQELRLHSVQTILYRINHIDNLHRIFVQYTPDIIAPYYAEFRLIIYFRFRNMILEAKKETYWKEMYWLSENRDLIV